MKYYIIFESDDENDFDCMDISGFGNSLGYEFDEIPDTVTVHKFPAEMPVSSSYDFQSYHNGYAKGYNDCLKTLLGEKLGEYDPEKDKVVDKE